MSMSPRDKILFNLNGVRYTMCQKHAKNFKGIKKFKYKKTYQPIGVTYYGEIFILEGKLDTILKLWSSDKWKYEPAI